MQARVGSVDEKREIVVVGAGGRAGSAYVKELRSAGYRVKATLRPGGDPAALVTQGATPVEMDAHDASSVRRAIEGAGVVVISLLGRGADAAADEAVITGNVIDAAANGGVEHLVYTSVLHADRATGVPHFEVKRSMEHAIRRSGMRYTFLRPSTFMDGFNAPWIRHSIQHEGVLASPIALATTISYLDTADLGVFGRIAIEEDQLRNAALELGGPRALAYSELLPIIEKLLGRPLTYRQTPIHEVAAAFGQDLAEMIQYFNKENFSVDMRSTLRRFPVKLTTIEEFLERSGWCLLGSALSG